MTVLLLFSLLTHFLQGSGQRTEWPAEAWFCAQLSIFVLFLRFCVWIIVRLEDPNMAHYKISNRVSHLLILYLLVFDIIHDAMCLNKMSRTSSRNIGPQHHKYSSIFHCTHGVLIIPVFTNPSWVFLLKCSFFSSSDHRSQSHLKFQSCLTTEYAGVVFG